MIDKKLLTNLVVHTETHNRLVEEEQCWREILHRRKDREAKEFRRHSKSKHHSSKSAQIQQALDSYERELRREAKRRLEEAGASDSSSTKHKSDIWLSLIGQQNSADRWRHDGWEELQRPGPPLTESFVLTSESGVKNAPQVSKITKPVTKNSHTNKTISIAKPLATSEEYCPLSIPLKPHKRSKKERKRHKKEKKLKSSDKQPLRPPKSERDERQVSRSSSISTVHSDEEIEWLERK